MMSQWHLVLEFLSLLLYRIFLILYSYILFFYVFNSNLIHLILILYNIRLYIYCKAPRATSLAWCYTNAKFIIIIMTSIR